MGYEEVMGQQPPLAYLKSRHRIYLNGYWYKWVHFPYQGDDEKERSLTH